MKTKKTKVIFDDGSKDPQDIERISIRTVFIHSLNQYQVRIFKNGNEVIGGCLAQFFITKDNKLTIKRSSGITKLLSHVVKFDSTKQNRIFEEV